MESSIVENEAFSHTLQLLNSSVISMALTTAAELNLFNIITDAGPDKYISPSEIAAKLPTNNPRAPEMVDRMLKLLASYNVVKFKSSMGDVTGGRIEMRYGANQVTKYLSENDQDRGSLAPVLKLYTDHNAMECWYNLKNAVLYGEDPFNRAHGMNTYEFAHIHPTYNVMFNEAMKGFTCIVTKKVLEVYRGFDDLNVLVDVGCGTGATLNAIIARHPHIKGIGFDLPHVIANAPSLSGIEYIAGDMFESVPSGNAILLKSLLCDWDDEHVLKILKNCWKALPINGKVTIISEILPMMVEEKPITSAEKNALLLDLLLMAQLPSGKTRSEKQFEDLAKSAGFSSFKRVCDCADTTVMELYK